MVFYSKYLFGNLPTGLEGKSCPKWSYQEDGTIDKVWETDLSDGKLKNVIEHRIVIVSHYSGNDELCKFTDVDLAMPKAKGDTFRHRSGDRNDIRSHGK